MRHLVKGSKLGRDTGHRKATLRALATSLIREHRIQTTVPKAKALRGFVEPLITRAKEDTSHNRRQVFSKLQNKDAVDLLFNEVGPMAKDRPGGYTRVLKTGFRAGDGAEMAVIELVDYNDVQPEGTGSQRKRTRRAGRNKKTTSATPDTQAKKEESGNDEEE
jgi:large subunit ribosomal protein L17